MTLWIVRSELPTRVFLLVLGLCAAFALYWYIPQWRSESRIASGGARTTATVVEKRQTTGSRGKNIIVFRYSDQAGQQHQADQSVSDSEYAAVQSAGPVEVSYDPIRPSVALIVGTEQRVASANLIFIIPAGIALPLCLFGAFWPPLRRILILRTGTFVTGEIVALARKKDKGKPTLGTLKYRYTTPDGEIREGSYDAIPTAIMAYAKPGDPIRVAYLPARPRWNQADIFALATTPSSGVPAGHR